MPFFAKKINKTPKIELRQSPNVTINRAPLAYIGQNKSGVKYKKTHHT
jgi:hypothetical protein